MTALVLTLSLRSFSCLWTEKTVYNMTNSTIYCHIGCLVQWDYTYFSNKSRVFILQPIAVISFPTLNLTIWMILITHDQYNTIVVCKPTQHAYYTIAVCNTMSTTQLPTYHIIWLWIIFKQQVTTWIGSLDSLSTSILNTRASPSFNKPSFPT